LKIINARNNCLSSRDLALISTKLQLGEVVVIPTETVYGLAADAMNPEAVNKIFHIKGRPRNKALTIHLSDFNMLNDLVLSVPNDAAKLISAFWPGPLTLVLEKTEKVSSGIAADSKTVGVRMPGHEVALEIIKATNSPLVVPSANLSGKINPTIAKHCINDLSNKIDLIVDGGPCQLGIESTVISMIEKPYRILRAGAITKSQIEGVVENVLVPIFHTDKKTATAN
jgi:L-threonylcarbamoyladenylate synthase